jgi:hypothetical protein
VGAQLVLADKAPPGIEFRFKRVNNGKEHKENDSRRTGENRCASLEGAMHDMHLTSSFESGGGPGW